MTLQSLELWELLVMLLKMAQLQFIRQTMNQRKRKKKKKRVHKAFEIGIFLLSINDYYSKQSKQSEQSERSS